MLKALRKGSYITKTKAIFITLYYVRLYNGELKDVKFYLISLFYMKMSLFLPNY